MKAKKHPSKPVITSVTLFQEAVGELADGLDEIANRIAGRFPRSEPRRYALAYLRGLLSPVERKNCWQLAEEVGHHGPDPLQRMLRSSTWDGDGLRDDTQDYVVAHLGEPDAVLPVDETGFIKKGDESVGVQRQYTGTAGKVENSQVGVFLGYASSKGRALIDRALYLPESWANAPERRLKARVPDEVTFKTKPELARDMLAHAFDRGVPGAWVVADEVYGRDGKFRRFLEQRGKGYVVAIPSNYAVPCGKAPVTAAGLAAELPASAWKAMSAGDGTKGPRVHDWALRRLDAPARPGFDAWLLVRRERGEKAKLTYYWAFAPADTKFAKLVSVAGKRWTVEECFERAKGEVGLDQYEARHWTAWHRHITLSMLALAYLEVVRAKSAERRATAEKGALGAGGQGIT